MSLSERPLFSVVLITHNRADLVSKSIESVINQKYKDWELIVVDDGSSDNTREVVTSYDDTRVNYLYQESQHVSTARNNGIDHARGRYICFLDDDDWFYDNHLWELKQEIERKGYPVAFFYTGICEYYNSEKIKQRPLPDKPIENGIEHVLMNTILPSSSCLHHDILKKHQFITEHIPAEDRSLWIRVAAEYPVYQVSSYTVSYFRHEQQATAIIYNELQWNVIEQAITSIKNILKSKKIRHAVSKTTVRQFLSRSYYWYMFNAINQKDRKKSFKLLFKSIKEYPAMLIKKKTLAAVRDIIFIN